MKGDVILIFAYIIYAIVISLIIALNPFHLSYYLTRIFSSILMMPLVIVIIYIIFSTDTNS